MALVWGDQRKDLLLQSHVLKIATVWRFDLSKCNILLDIGLSQGLLHMHFQGRTCKKHLPPSGSGAQTPKHLWGSYANANSLNQPNLTALFIQSIETKLALPSYTHFCIIRRSFKCLGSFIIKLTWIAFYGKNW